eukprot:m.226727 g.226727  ORF g.226727 m.226727 type:complete len:60 (-) comp18803_c0_seq1:111-290(-)
MLHKLAWAVHSGRTGYRVGWLADCVLWQVAGTQPLLLTSTRTVNQTTWAAVVVTVATAT